LLNTVYKIASGCIVARFKKYLDKIINPDQTGFYQIDILEKTLG
jgi:hypothetical protein